MSPTFVYTNDLCLYLTSLYSLNHFSEAMFCYLAFLHILINTLHKQK